jgi:glycosyltransferase involved in cell wall biosynthesis
MVLTRTIILEAQPKTILQANLCGVPVVGARAGGIPESINDEVTGYVVDGDDHGAFSDRISRLLSDTELNASMSAEAIAFARHHEPAGVALTWERLYRTLPGVL